MAFQKKVDKAAPTASPKGKKSTLRAMDFRLIDIKAPAFMLKTGRLSELLVFDEEKGYKRPIRHCPNERSIYLDEQSQYAIVEPVIFLTGYLQTQPTDVHTQQFLLTHPDNVANGGTIFELVDDERDAEDTLEVEELILDIKQAIRDKAREGTESSLVELEAAVAVLTGSIATASKMTPAELKRTLFQHATDNPLYFTTDGKIDIFKNDFVAKKYIGLRAISEGIIRKSQSGRELEWVKDGTKILRAPIGVDLLDTFADFLNTEDGYLLIQEIEKRF